MIFVLSKVLLEIFEDQMVTFEYFMNSIVIPESFHIPKLLYWDICTDFNLFKSGNTHGHPHMVNILITTCTEAVGLVCFNNLTIWLAQLKDPFNLFSTKLLKESGLVSCKITVTTPHDNNHKN